VAVLRLAHMTKNEHCKLLELAVPTTEKRDGELLGC